MKLIKRIFKSGLPIVWGVVGAFLLLMSSCKAPQELTSNVESEEYNYSSCEEKSLTSEIALEIESVAESTLQAEEKVRHYEYTSADIDMLARLVLREAGGCAEDEQRLIVWTVFQRVDSTDYDFRNMNTIEAVVTAPYQFAYDETAPIKEGIRELCVEELEKWVNGATPPTLDPYAPALPYLFFEGDGRHNWFRAEW